MKSHNDENKLFERKLENLALKLRKSQIQLRVLKFILRILKSPSVIGCMGWFVIIIFSVVAFLIKIRTGMSDIDFWQGISVEIYGAVLTAGAIVYISKMIEKDISKLEPNLDTEHEIAELRREIAELKQMIKDLNEKD